MRDVAEELDRLAETLELIAEAARGPTYVTWEQTEHAPQRNRERLQEAMTEILGLAEGAISELAGLQLLAERQ